MLPYNSQESSYNFLTTSNCLSHHDFPAPSDNSLLQSQQFVTCCQEPSFNNNADRTKQRTKQRSEGQRKILTKQGLRDRRVRLSVEVAHKFFKLQDLLGFDKASATVDWLINQSRVSIEQHLNVDFSDIHFGKKEHKSVIPRKALKSKNERRKEARTRARERTMEKKIKLTMERDVENVDGDQCLFSKDMVYYCQDYLDGSYDDYMNSCYEHLNGDSLPPFHEVLL